MKGGRTDWRRRAPQIAMGAALSLGLMLGVATLSARPAWKSLADDTALLRLSFTHSGARQCRNRTEAELAALPPNMRDPKICDRRRAPVRIEMDVDGTTEIATDLAPSGLAGSGPSRVYHRVELPGGPHRIELRLSDDPARQRFSHVAAFDISLEPGQSLAVDFDAASGGFFQHGTER